MKPIKVYTTPACGYCNAAKRLLSSRNLPYEEIDLAEDPELRRRLSHENGGYQTVPMIFVGDHFVGGYTDLAALDRKGELQALLQ